MPSPATAALLAPAAMLIFWSLIMLGWLTIARFLAFRAASLDMRNIPAGGRGQDLDTMLPQKANWPSHNYTHLMEQPTLFYAVIVILALLEQGTPLTIALAWSYTGLRIIHSIWQANVNRVGVRSLLFLLSTIALIGLSIIALKASLWPGA